MRTKLLFTLGIIAIYRFGTFIPAPGVDYANVQQCLKLGNTQGGVFDFVNLFSGGALLQVSIFALGIMPYITASIIIQLLRVVIPHFQALYEEGPQGQNKLTQYTRYLTVALAVLNATTIVTLARTGALFGGGCPYPAIPDANLWTIIVLVIALTTGALVLMWMGEIVTEKGIGNGMSLMIFTSICATFPGAMGSILTAKGWGPFLVVIAVGICVVGLVVFVEQSQRRIPVHYAKRMVGRRTVGGTSTYIPLKLNMAGVIPVIFASSILMLPSLIAQFVVGAHQQNPPAWAVWIQNNLTRGDHPLYLVLMFVLVIAFAYFYVSITFNPWEVADNMKMYGGFIPGIRAGAPTAQYLQYVISRLTFAGAIYLGVIAILPLLVMGWLGTTQNFPLGGTSILIMVGVGLETVKQIDAQLQQRHYEGLLR